MLGACFGHQPGAVKGSLLAQMVKNPPASAGDVRDAGSIPRSGRAHGGGQGNPLQYPCLENPVDGGAWWATVHGVPKSQTRPSDFTFTFQYSWASLVAQLVKKNLPTMQETWVRSPLEKGEATHPSILAWRMP